MFFLFLALLATGKGFGVQPEDSVVFNRFVRYARERHLERLPRPERVTAIGEFFVGTPYVGGTLDRGEREELVVNLRELDCVTFVDNVLALALLDEYDAEGMADFLRNLRTVRYRRGVIAGYASRLHYSTDWLCEMCRAGILRDVTRELGGIPLPNKVGLVTATADKRPAFRRDSSLLPKMRAVEDSINARTTWYIPRGRVTDTLCGRIEDGDIILFTSGKKGLDTNHVGIALRRDGRVRVLHASSGGRRVMVSEEDLPGYLRRIASHTGIIIARLNS